MVHVSGGHAPFESWQSVSRCSNQSRRVVIMYWMLSPSPTTNATYVVPGSLEIGSSGFCVTTFASTIGEARVEKKDRLPAVLATAPILRESRHRVCAS